jgi:hypothetical protein
MLCCVVLALSRRLLLASASLEQSLLLSAIFWLFYHCYLYRYFYHYPGTCTIGGTIAIAIGVFATKGHHVCARVWEPCLRLLNAYAQSRPLLGTLSHLTYLHFPSSVSLSRVWLPHGKSRGSEFPNSNYTFAVFMYFLCRVRSRMYCTTTNRHPVFLICNLLFIVHQQVIPRDRCNI